MIENYNLFNLPLDLQTKILFSSNLKTSNLCRCEQVCKLFHNLINSEVSTNYWKEMAIPFDPSANWGNIEKERGFSWKNWVIAYKKSELRILNVLDTLSKFSNLKNKIHLGLMTPFMHTDNSKSQCYIAFMQEMGYGTAVNYPGAIKFLELAAKQNHRAAQFRLSECYEKGQGCLPDPIKAFNYCSLAAENTTTAENSLHLTAKNRLGYLYQNGIGCPKDPAKAINCYEEAANKGFLEAQMTLGECYEKGIGCERNPAKAFEYYELAAKQESPKALFCLGRYYLKGFGCESNLDKAMEYLKKAAKENFKDAQDLLKLLANDETGEPPQKRQRTD